MKAPCNRQTSIIGIFGGRPSAGCSSLTARQTAIATSTQCNRHHLHPHYHQCLHFMTSKTQHRVKKKKSHFYPSLQVVEVEIFSCSCPRINYCSFEDILESKCSTLSLKVKVDLFQFVAKLEQEREPKSCNLWLGATARDGPSPKLTSPPPLQISDKTFT